MTRVVLIALGLGIAVSPALAQNLTPPAFDVRAQAPAVEIFNPVPTPAMISRVGEGRSAYEARRVHRFRHNIR